MTYFTFYCLVKTNNGYTMKPHINIYDNMIETINWESDVYLRG